jgi:hypothetical protein
VANFEVKSQLMSRRVIFVFIHDLFHHAVNNLDCVACNDSNVRMINE